MAPLAIDPGRPVLLVVMPFASIRPAIGVSLLKALLGRRGIEADILYLNMQFADETGICDFNHVGEMLPAQSLAGDWVFAEALRGPRPDIDRDYLNLFPARFEHHRDAAAVPGILKRCRARADAFIERCLTATDWSRYGLIGFTSTFAQHAASLALAKRIKAIHPDIPIALGGANCEGDMGLATHAAFPFVDLVFSGEADLSFPEALDRLRSGRSVADLPGVISREGAASHCASLVPDRVRSLDDLPLPDYADYFAQLGAMAAPPCGGRVVLMESSRGCWWGQKHHCTFCGLNGMAMAFRSKSPGRVVEEARALCAAYRPDMIEMVDNILDMRYFADVLPAFERDPPGAKFFYETKANLRRQHVAQLKAAGVETIQPGIESLDGHVLAIMRKGTSAIQNIQLLKWCREFGVKAYWNLLYGFPGEAPADYERMVVAMAALHHLEPPHGTGAIRLDRFSPNYEQAGELGFHNVRADRSYHHVYDLEPELLARIAYFFEHDYADGLDPESYAGALRQAVIDWHGDSASRGLIQVDHGDVLALWDFRSGAVRTLTVLEGFERDLYLHCDGGRSAEDVAAFAVSAGIDPTLALDLTAQWVAARAMIEVDGRLLSVAVNQAAAGDAAVPELRRDCAA